MTAVTGRHLLLALLLQAHGKQTAGMLARWMDVHRRTIARDADELKRAGYKVDRRRGPTGGYALGAGTQIRLAHFINSTDIPDERHLREAVGAAMATVPADRLPAVRSLLDRLVAEQQPDGVPSGQGALVRTLRGALWRRQRISAAIRGAPQDEPEQHILHPLMLTYLGDVWYFSGVSPDRVLHVHDLSRVADITMLDEPAEPPDDLDVRVPSY